MIFIIISASRRTDIPAFYSEWFINRIRAGYFIKVNPYNAAQRKRVSLLPPEVDALVFWTKNPLPLLKYLPWLDQQKYRYLFHFTLNKYSDVLEPRVPAFKDRLAIFKKLSNQIGPARVIWRYDPIIVSNLNSIEDHLEQFGQIARMLQGDTHRVMISFLALYPKVKRRLKKLAQESFFKLSDMRDAAQLANLTFLANGLSEIARENGLKIYSCSEQLNFENCHIPHGSCIDIRLINQIFDTRLEVNKDKYQRPECGCTSSIDMGFYNTCKFECRYCYANSNSQVILRNIGQHDPQSSIMVGADADFTLE